jgi:hypothetical protein
MGRDRGQAVVNHASSISRFLEQCELASARLTPLAGGANNRVYRVDAGDRVRVLKHYFTSLGDPRDRFGAEHDFYELLWRRGCRRIPEPLAWDRPAGLGLFEHVEGGRLKAGVVNGPLVEQARDFILDVNRRAGREGVASLKPASEACFSIPRHLDVVGGRMQRLTALPGESPVDRQARRFVEEDLLPAWRTVRAGVEQAMRDELNRELTPSERCVSPSDFGFHNAILRASGSLCFHDFEYAGSDDPAKLACDFFCQPRVPVPMEQWDAFVKPLGEACGWGAGFAARSAVLLPVYQLKWCCIMLNEFLRSEAERREFAEGAETAESRRNTQLQCARAALARLRDTSHRPPLDSLN